MRTDLLELLSRRAIVHPTRLDRFSSSFDCSVSVGISGYPWWRDSAARKSRGKAVLHFEGIDRGSIDVEFFRQVKFDRIESHSDLENFSVVCLSDEAWARGEWWHVFCHAPLADPMAFYAEFHDYLRSIRCPHPPSLYLNCMNSLTEVSLKAFSAHASSTSYQLCGAPEEIARWVCGELDRCGTGHKILKSSENKTGLRLVRFGQSYFTCANAFIEY